MSEKATTRARRLAPLLVALVAASVTALSAAAAVAAPWCGTVSSTDRPAAAGGPQVRVLYAIASDGVDASAEWAPRISADVDTITEWWRRNDGSRVPRFDRVAFGCGEQPDIRLARIAPRVGDLTSVTDPGTILDHVIDLVESLDTKIDQFKYLVYLDVRFSNRTTCGQGAGSFAGPGVAVVYLHTCEDVRTAPVAVHELLHAMGAVPRSGPPNACPDSLAHVCDSTGDVMAPYAEYAELPVLALDIHNDDYYGHSGAWADIQDSKWLQRLDVGQPITVAVTGPGRVVSTEPGFDCTGTCTLPWNPGSRVTLEPKPDEGKSFVRWSGACTGGSTPCAFDVGQATTVTALFAPSTFSLDLRTTGSGRIVASSPVLSCAGQCRKVVPSFSPVTLGAVPARGWRLKAWSGTCSSVRPTCTAKMTADTAVRAVFVKKKP